ncbi:MAG: cyclic nucleotide-binding protein [Maribacter sp.]|nr:MAG: cyclic nucleotide-binding protein [Maribacter sp.]
MKEQIKRYFSRYVDFSDAEIDEVYSKLIPKTVEKKDYLLREGQVCKSNYFILSGLVRSFYIDNKGNEKITQFALENWWVTNMESFIGETPSLLSMQALEKTQLLLIDKVELEKLYISIPKLERLFRIITENMLIAIQRRNDIYLQMKSKDRYDYLVAHLPNFVQRVPQYMIASYLEITPEYLSDLRRK